MLARWRALAILSGIMAAAAVVVLAAVGLIAALERGDEAEVRATLSAAEALGGADTVGYRRADSPRTFSFPEDHGPHPGFRTEWWYFTGNLEAEDGRAFGYQLTFFRSALTAALPERASAWGTGAAWMAHFALTDVRAERFHHSERLARDAVGLAGAETQPWRVWVERWRATSVAGAPTGTRTGVFPVRLRAAEGEIALDLVLERGKPPVLQGERGLSRKGPDPGNASYYYSLTRMPTAGEIHVAGDTFQVRGNSWMDREWSTSALGEDLEGWDWFALQLDDGRELVYYRLRREDGRANPFSAGKLIEASGTARTLGPGDVALEVLDWWASPADGTRYPVEWRVRVPSAGLNLVVVPWLADQELRATTVRYWEGAVTVTGVGAGGRAGGVGYIELTGYGAG